MSGRGMIRAAMDHEERASRFLDAFGCVRNLLANGVRGLEIDACQLAQLLDLLNDEAKIVVVPFRRGPDNDDGEDDPG